MAGRLGRGIRPLGGSERQMVLMSRDLAVLLQHLMIYACTSVRILTCHWFLEEALKWRSS